MFQKTSLTSPHLTSVEPPELWLNNWLKAYHVRVSRFQIGPRVLSCNPSDGLRVLTPYLTISSSSLLASTPMQLEWSRSSHPARTIFQYGRSSRGHCIKVFQNLVQTLISFYITWRLLPTTSPHSTLYAWANYEL